MAGKGLNPNDKPPSQPDPSPGDTQSRVPDAKKLEELLFEIETDSEAMTAMFFQLEKEVGISPPEFQPVSADEQGRLDEKQK